jgi:hypothetical protein
VIAIRVASLFAAIGARPANIEGIKRKGLKNSLEKALTYAHIIIR